MTLSNKLENSNVTYDKKDDFFECVHWITNNKFEKICLQFPDNLLSESGRIALIFEEFLDRKVYILGDTTCGCCCIDEVAANHINADAVVHFGPACLNPTSKLPVFHIFPRETLNTKQVCETFVKTFEPERKVVLFYDVFYAHLISTIWQSLKDKFKNLILSKLNCKSNIKFTDADEEQNKFVVSGRTWTLEKEERIEDYHAVFIGENNRTLAALSFSIPAKSWWFMNDQKVEKFEVEENPWLKRRRFLVEKLKDAKTVGIVIATLGIKNYLESLSVVKSILKSKNKKMYIFNVGKPNPAKLANFSEIDVFVVITCPESDIFESREYFKPLLTPFEVEIAFNYLRDPICTSYCLDFRQLLPGGTNYVKYKPFVNPDVSLISGEIRDNCHNNSIISDKMEALMIRSEGTVAVGKAGANFLLNRSWQGLEQKLGQSEIKPLETGRSGLPVNYISEPMCKN